MSWDIFSNLDKVIANVAVAAALSSVASTLYSYITSYREKRRKIASLEKYMGSFRCG